MAGKQQIKLKKHLSRRKLEKLIKQKEIQVKLLKRLNFIEKLYKGAFVPEACKEIGISTPTGYQWLKLWNEGSYFGLFPKYDYQYEDIIEEYDLEILDFKLSKMDKVNLNNAKKIFSDNFGRNFSDIQIKYYLRELCYKRAKIGENYIKSPILSELDLEKLELKLISSSNLTFYDVRELIHINTKKMISLSQFKCILKEIGYKYDDNSEKIIKNHNLDESNFKWIKAKLSKKTKQPQIEDVRKIIYEDTGFFFSDFQIKNILIELEYIDKNKSKEPIIINKLYKSQLKCFESQLSKKDSFTLDEAKEIMSAITKENLSDFQIKTILQHLDYSNEYYKRNSKKTAQKSGLEGI